MGLTASVIICTRNRCHDLMQCLASLAIQTKVPTELIIVDSSDIPLTEQSAFVDFFTTKLFPSTVLHYRHTKPGLTYQRNQGISASQGDIIYFFDDDVILSTTYLEHMQQIFQHNALYAGGMGDISNINKSVSWRYQLFRHFFLLPHEQGSGNFTWSGMPTHPYGTQQFKKVEVLGGCCMAFRADILKQYLFDETMHSYCYLEDADIAWRISRTRPLFFNPAAQLEHRESPQARHSRIEIHAMFIYNYSYLFFKNIYPLCRIKIIAYWWSLCGLFLQAKMLRDREQLKGFYKGLSLFYKRKRSWL